MSDDARFGNKHNKMKRTLSFSAILDKKVAIQKIQLDVLRPWVTEKITSLINVEDEIVIQYAMNFMEGKRGHGDACLLCGKDMHINLLPFLETKTSQFMKELWQMLISAERSSDGIPDQLRQKGHNTDVRRHAPGPPTLINNHPSDVIPQNIQVRPPPSHRPQNANSFPISHPQHSFANPHTGLSRHGRPPPRQSERLRTAENLPPPPLATRFPTSAPPSMPPPPPLHLRAHHPMVESRAAPSIGPPPPPEIQQSMASHKFERRQTHTIVHGEKDRINSIQHLSQENDRGRKADGENGGRSGRSRSRSRSRSQDCKLHRHRDKWRRDGGRRRRRDPPSPPLDILQERISGRIY